MAESIDWRGLMGRYMKNIYPAENILYSISESECINKKEYIAFEQLYDEIKIKIDAKEREQLRKEQRKEIGELEIKLNKLKDKYLEDF